jgi:hypothetical protein
MVLEWPAASRQFHLKPGVRLRLAKKATSSGPWRLGGIRKACSASIFEGGGFSCEPALDDSRFNVLTLGHVLVLGTP